MVWITTLRLNKFSISYFSLYSFLGSSTAVSKKISNFLACSATNIFIGNGSKVELTLTKSGTRKDGFYCWFFCTVCESQVLNWLEPDLFGSSIPDIFICSVAFACESQGFHEFFDKKPFHRFHGKKKITFFFFQLVFRIHEARRIKKHGILLENSIYNWLCSQLKIVNCRHMDATISHSFESQTFNSWMFHFHFHSADVYALFSEKMKRTNTIIIIMIFLSFV